MANRIIDIYVVYQVIKRLSTRFVNTDAYKLGLIDKDGNFLKNRKEMTSEEKKALTKFDVMIFNIKKLLSKLPGGDSSFRNFATSLWLLKEDIEEGYDITEDDVVELSESISYDNSQTLKTLKEFMNEEVTTASGGSSAGAGIANSINSGSIDNKVVKVSNVGKCRVYDVSTKTFIKCRNGKKKKDRFKSYVGEGPVSDDIRDYAKRNPMSSIMLRDKQTGAHTFLKIGSKEKF
tara:strand:- start:843 stop:1544 length:702 start_codon:yes stop_codon:yes gene_type:complete